jgi:hypothetical protein
MPSRRQASQTPEKSRLRQSPAFQGAQESAPHDSVKSAHKSEARAIAIRVNLTEDELSLYSEEERFPNEYRGWTTIRVPNAYESRSLLTMAS